MNLTDIPLERFLMKETHARSRNGARRDDAAPTLEARGPRPCVNLRGRAGAAESRPRRAPVSPRARDVLRLLRPRRDGPDAARGPGAEVALGFSAASPRRADRARSPGARPVSGGFRGAASMRRPAALSCLEDLAGCLYVLEGACLGGQVIAQVLHQRLGVAKGSGARSSPAMRRGRWPRWTLFVAWLDGLARAGASTAKIIVARRATFEPSRGGRRLLEESRGRSERL